MIREESRDNAGGGSDRVNWTGRFVATIPISVHSRFSISSRDRRRYDRLGEESQTDERCLTFSLARLVSTSEWLRFRNAFTGGVTPLNPARRETIARTFYAAHAMHRPHPVPLFHPSSSCSFLFTPSWTFLETRGDHLRENQRRAEHTSLRDINVVGDLSWK